MRIKNVFHSARKGLEFETIHWLFLPRSCLFSPTTMCNVHGSDNTRHNMTPGQLATFLCISTAGVKLVLWQKPKRYFQLESMNQDYEVKHNLKFMGHKLLHLALPGTSTWWIPWLLLSSWKMLLPCFKFYSLKGLPNAILLKRYFTLMILLVKNPNRLSLPTQSCELLLLHTPGLPVDIYG